MKILKSRAKWALSSVLWLLTVAAVSCSDDTSSPAPNQAEWVGLGGFADRPVWTDADGTDTEHVGGSGAGPGASGLPCELPRAVPLPARKAVMSEDLVVSSRAVFVRDMYGLFQSYCGACHVDTSLGGFNDEPVTFANFSEVVDQEAIDFITSDDPEEFMPKPIAGGIAWSERAADDPIVSFVGLLEAWLAAGSPKDVFFIENEQASEASPYLLSPEQGEGQTNIGNCLPEPKFFATEDERSLELDEEFKKMKELPADLTETDLFTLDDSVLAYHGVLAIAPAYPLWSDDAGKIRHLRLPHGKSLVVDPKTNEFKIPDNTRVYKTFLKKVIEEDGRVAYRKIETRIIVVRNDDCSSGSCEVKALYGTYAWNESETEAKLVTDPLRSGAPFRDRLVTYITDEAKAKAAGTDAELLAGATRHYAIPGSSRCEQCHLGSPNASFVLGVSPVQLNRLPYVEEPDEWAYGTQLLGDGILKEDDPEKDELSQMTRLIQLGIVSGIDSPAEVVHLKALGSVPPRNALELRAQGYMLGNCSGCHNPRGFPSLKLPELAGLLNFYPSKGGGIYQFPLETYSPRVRRGDNLEYEVPYISPSLWDRPGLDAAVTPGSLYSGSRSKCVNSAIDPSNQICVEAPWRSLIYRNVETPFTTADDNAIYAHMPRHSAGFDCRAPRILGEWMVSIPSKLKPLGKDLKGNDVVLESEMLATQPYVAVELNRNGYDRAVADAQTRLDAYRTGDRYGYCPDTSDVVDPEVLSGDYDSPQDRGMYLEGNPVSRWYDGNPDRAHWSITDLTEPPGDWAPRRADWADILLQEDEEKFDALNEEEKRLVQILGDTDLSVASQFKNYALTPQPLGVWRDNVKCESAYSKMMKLSELGVEPYWAAAVRKKNQNKDLPVFETSPGAAVFGIICRNCHGPAANGVTALADTISDITGGTARVANLRDGIFGPLGGSGDNAEKVFGESAEDLDLKTEDLTARYLLWMALGGTKVEIPMVALKIVQAALFLGEPRFGGAPPSANMLSGAEDICRATLPAGSLYPDGDNTVESMYKISESTVEFDLITGMKMDTWNSTSKFTPLIVSNGDAGLWIELCAARQKTPIRALQIAMSAGFDAVEGFVPPSITSDATVALDGADFFEMYKLYDPESYGSQPVMTPSGIRNGVSVGTSQAWCLDRAKTELGMERMTQWALDNAINGQPYPICPLGVEEWGIEEQRDFVTRGAMTAGLAVMVYLQAIAKGEMEPALQYDECSLLPQ